MTYTFRRVATEPRINGNGEFINKIYLEVTYKSYGKDTQRFFVEDLIQPGPTSDPKKLPISDLSSGQIMSRAAGDSFRDIPVPGRGPEYSPSNTSDGSGIKGFIIGAINSALRNPITYVEALYKGLNIINDIYGKYSSFHHAKGNLYVNVPEGKVYASTAEWWDEVGQYLENSHIFAGTYIRNDPRGTGYPIDLIQGVSFERRECFLPSTPF